DCEEVFGEVVRWARETRTADGGRVIDQPWVRQRLAEADARLSAVRLMNWRLVRDTADGTLGPGDASAVKGVGTDTTVAVSRLLLEVVGPEGTLRDGSPGALLHGRLEAMNRRAQINTFGGGVSEVQREIVAYARLGMTRGRR